MARGITIEVDRRDLRRLNKAIEDYARVRKVDNAYAVNRTAKDVAFRAVKYTKAASTGEVESQLKRDIQVRTTSSRTGKPLTRPRQSYLPSSLARAVFSKRLRMGQVNYEGLPRGKVDPSSLGRRKFDVMLKKYIGARVASTNFIRAGFLGAAKAFAKFKGGESRPTIKGRKSGKGKGIIARPGTRTVATLINYSTSKSKSSSAALARYGGAGAAAAVRDKTKDLAKYIREKLEEQAKKFNRK